MALDVVGVALVHDIVSSAKENGVELHFPTDHVVADKFSPEANSKVVTDAEGVPDGWMALDVGPESQAKFCEVMRESETILWNGPMGVFEFEKFACGTKAAMQTMIDVTKRGATTVIGGGDTGAAAREVIIDGVTVADQITHCSTGGGSSLVLMEGKSLPAVDHLSDIVDLPPKGVDFSMVWIELQKLKRENMALQSKVKSVDANQKAPK